MATQFSVVGMSFAGAAINTAYSVSHHHDPFPTMLAGAMFMGACVAAGGFNPELGAALAGVYLLGTVIYRGEYFVGFVNDLIGSSSSKNVKKGKAS